MSIKVARQCAGTDEFGDPCRDPAYDERGDRDLCPAHANRHDEETTANDDAADGLEPTNPTLPIEDLRAVIAEVDAMPAPTFLARPVWPDGAYGVIGAESKAGKTWAVGDLAITVAAGGSWLGQFPCERPGPVLAFLGEGGKRPTIRRWRAIAEHHAVDLASLPIRLCHRVPQLTVADHLSTIRHELEAHPAVLVIVDPFYLAAKGAKSADLFAMGDVLEPIQHACADAGASLVIVHHWNLNGTGKGKERFSGTGTEQWGRVLASVSVENRHTDPITKETSVVLGWTFVGEEIPDTDLRLRRKVRADDPDDLASPMRYSIEHLTERGQQAAGDLDGEKPAVRRIWAHLHEAQAPLTVANLGDLCAADHTGIPLKTRTIQDALGRLRDLGRARCEAIAGGAGALAWTARTEGAHDHPSQREENTP